MIQVRAMAVDGTAVFGQVSMDPRSFLAFDDEQQLSVVEYLIEVAMTTAIRDGINLHGAVWTGLGLPPDCDTFWGSHGCDKPLGHVEEGDAVHRCGDEDDPCSECIVLGPDDDGDDPNAAMRYMTYNVYADGTVLRVGWSEWMPGRWYP